MIVVSNTSPLTNLEAIGQFELLQKLYGTIHIPDGVWYELNAGGKAFCLKARPKDVSPLFAHSWRPCGMRLASI